MPRENFKKQPFYTYKPALSVRPIMQLAFSPTCEGSPGLQSLAYVQAGERPAACLCDEVTEVTGPALMCTPCHWRCKRCHIDSIQVILVAKVSKGVAFWSWQHMSGCTQNVHMLMKKESLYSPMQFRKFRLIYTNVQRVLHSIRDLKERKKSSTETALSFWTTG